MRNRVTVRIRVKRGHRTLSHPECTFFGASPRSVSPVSAVSTPDCIGIGNDHSQLGWKIETAFQKLEKHLYSEINTLGYPQAALFGFCLALVALNLLQFFSEF